MRYEPSGLLPLQPSPRLEGLTERQLDVLRLLAQGKSNKEIGRALDISHYTVRIHVSSLLRALDVPSRTAAAVKYRAALGMATGSSGSDGPGADQTSCALSCRRHGALVLTGQDHAARHVQ